MTERHVPVLVVGGSLVGLTSSALLAHHGVEHLLVESHAGTAIHPRAASFHQRTMEVFRSIGLQREVEEAAAREFRQNGAIIAVESLGGKELAHFYHSYNDGVEGLSPTDRLFVTQVGLEPVLRRRAHELGGEHLFGTELVSFEEHDDHVRTRLRTRDGGAETVVTSDYLLAADGAHSRIRERLGIPMSGRGTLAECVTIYFKADVRALIGERNLSVVYVNHPELLGFFRFSITGDSGFLAVFATFGPEGRNTQVGADLSTERCIDLVRTALGSDEALPVDVESVQHWTASAATAESFQHGRVFLAGDAAHVMPPTGGFGGNTGVADAHNLAWKLAMTSRGVAGPGLLDTYDAERRPISTLTVEQAYTRYALRADQSLPQDDLMPPLDDASIELGAIYRSAAVLDDQPPGQPLDDPRAQTWTVGARVPHVPLPPDNARSTIDLPDKGFAVIVTGDETAWMRAGDQAAHELGVPMRVHRLPPTERRPAEGTVRDTGNGQPAAALVRPDGVIAWKTSAPGDEAPSHLLEALSKVLSAG